MDMPICYCGPLQQFRMYTVTLPNMLLARSICSTPPSSKHTRTHPTPLPFLPVPLFQAFYVAKGIKLLKGVTAKELKGDISGKVRALLDKCIAFVRGTRGAHPTSC